jgi:DNA-binding response OmpR family regulator
MVGIMNERKVLVVDDEVLITDMLKAALGSAGYTVLTAGSAEEALDILKRESIMVMFLDLNLPGMNGLDLCKKIRKKNTIGIIFAMTGYSNFYGLLDCRTVGFDDFFIKPFKLDVLLKSVQEAFERLDRWAISDYDLA